MTISVRQEHSSIQTCLRRVGGRRAESTCRRSRRRQLDGDGLRMGRRKEARLFVAAAAADVRRLPRDSALFTGTATKYQHMIPIHGLPVQPNRGAMQLGNSNRFKINCHTLNNAHFSFTQKTTSVTFFDVLGDLLADGKSELLSKVNFGHFQKIVA